MQTDHLLRTCFFKVQNYAPKHPVVFKLQMWDTSRRDSRGQTVICYRLRNLSLAAAHQTIFEGEDFSGSPMHADDSDATVASLMNFLTLRPGDTDAEYFADYTATQLGFCHQYAEELAMVVRDRFARNLARSV